MAHLSLSKDKIRFLFLEGIHNSAVKTLEDAGYTNIEYHKKALSIPDLKEKISDAHFIGIRSCTQINSEILDSAQKLIGIGCFCIGTNQVDLNATMIRGIPVFNAPFSNTRSVAELVIAELILLMRDIPQKNARVHKGTWCKSAQNSYEIRGKKLGIIGYGNIGTQLGIMAESLGMQVLFYDISNKLPIGTVQKVETIEEILTQCDVVTLHVPETEQTKNMISSKQLTQMKEGSILINASRGTVVDLEALAENIENGHLRGAAIDVYPKEPRSNGELFESPLLKYDNIILTPHVGGSTMEAQENIGSEVAEKLITYSDNGSTISSVNFPEVNLPSLNGCHRLLHIHKNVPGIMTKINHVFSDKNINISSQYLRTNENIGYVVIDVDEEYSQVALEELRKIEGTIRTRVLF